MALGGSNSIRNTSYNFFQIVFSIFGHNGNLDRGYCFVLFCNVTNALKVLTRRNDRKIEILNRNSSKSFTCFWREVSDVAAQYTVFIKFIDQSWLFDLVFELHLMVAI